VTMTTVVYAVGTLCLYYLASFMDVN